jgi:hypothetical protein
MTFQSAADMADHVEARNLERRRTEAPDHREDAHGDLAGTARKGLGSKKGPARRGRRGRWGSARSDRCGRGAAPGGLPEPRLIGARDPVVTIDVCGDQPARCVGLGAKGIERAGQHRPDRNGGADRQPDRAAHGRSHTGGCQLRGILPRLLHPATAAGPQLRRRRAAQELHGAVDRGGSRSPPLRRQQGRSRLRGLTDNEKEPGA